jgi:hypothetical protein
VAIKMQFTESDPPSRCPECWATLTKDNVIQVSAELVQCPDCKLIFDPGKRGTTPPYKE